MFFFFFFLCFLLLVNVCYLFMSSLFFSSTRRATVAGDDHNLPKRRIWRRLGLRYVFFCFSSCFLLLANDFYFIWVVTIFFRHLKSYGGWRRPQRAQTTHPALFGP